ncbi:Fur family transcriptional regulator [Nesterenkonia populi]|uniref:Fur family transcriptional regulator n=1 Tax=Nesterenkonia populi TaxID=1591087 RepID=UPI0011BD99AE|nr:Fur family transcriptional regulator [Nesterenkonia populi]
MSGHAHHHHHRGEGGELVEAALEELRRQGERATAARRAVLQVLEEHHRHLSADEVAERLTDRGVHRTTAYRALERFAELGIVAVRQLAGEAASYHLATSTHLHGHCRGCQAVVALPPESFATAVEAVDAAAGFQLDLHQSTLTGLCSDCR